MSESHDDLPRHDWSHWKTMGRSLNWGKLMTEYEELTFWKVNEHDLITRKNWSSQCIENTCDLMTYLPSNNGWTLESSPSESWRLVTSPKIEKDLTFLSQALRKIGVRRIPEKSLMDCDPDIPPRYWLVLPLIRINRSLLKQPETVSPSAHQPSTQRPSVRSAAWIWPGG